MASKKDLIEAQGFSRRRLLTAFTAGAPGGKELEPAKPMRAVIAGIALAALVVVAGVFYGLLKPGLPVGWENNKLILVKDTGSRYLSESGTLYPVINSTSAWLLTPGDGSPPITTDSGSLADIPVGPSIGIVGAPDGVPSAANLVNSGWTACPVDGGVALELAGDADPTSVGTGTVVSSDGLTYVVAGSHRYAVSPDASANVASVLRELGLADQVPLEVDSRWLNLFSAGSDLEPITVPGAGTVAPGTTLVVGQVVTPQGTATNYLVTADGKLASLTPLAYRLYLLGTGTKLGEAAEVPVTDTIGVDSAPDSGYGTDWPADQLSPMAAESVSCAQLAPQEGGTARTVLAAATTAPDAGGVVITPRSGALVAAGGEGAEATREVVLVDELGTAYAIPNADEDVLSRLGYKTADVGAVPAAWMQFFAGGPDLTVEAARRTPQGVPVIADAPAPKPTEAAGEATASAATASVDSAATPLAVDSATADRQCEAGTITLSPERPEALSMLQTSQTATLATGAGITVAVVDSGIDAKNPHLRGAVVDGVNLVGDDADPRGMTDLNGHGTAIAGVIAARSVDGSGVIGVAPEANLLSVRVYRSDDEESFEAGFGPTAKTLAQGIRWAADHHADVINVSLSDEHDDPAVREAVEYADAHGALVVASAGNRNTAVGALDDSRYPAAYPAALSVTAVDSSGASTSDSIHGPHVELAAPGQNVLTSMSTGGDCMYGAKEPSSSYATAYASGAAALVAEYRRAETPAQWQYRLMASATRGNPDVRSDLVGWGTVQPYDAMVMVPGSGERGPANPFTGHSGLTVDAPSVALTPHEAESPFADTRTMMISAASGAAVLLGTLGVVLVYRRRSDVVVAPVAQPDGLLDKMRGESTRITPQP